MERNELETLETTVLINHMDDLFTHNGFDMLRQFAEKKKDYFGNKEQFDAKIRNYCINVLEKLNYEQFEHR